MGHPAHKRIRKLEVPREASTLLQTQQEPQGYPWANPDKEQQGDKEETGAEGKMFPFCPEVPQFVAGLSYFDGRIRDFRATKLYHVLH